jgi:hypothetical protein
MPTDSNKQIPLMKSLGQNPSKEGNSLYPSRNFRLLRKQCSLPYSQQPYPQPLSHLQWFTVIYCYFLLAESQVFQITFCLQVFLLKFCMLLISPLRATSIHPSHSPWLNRPNDILYSEKYKLRSPSLCSFLKPTLTSSLIDSNSFRHCIFKHPLSWRSNVHSLLFSTLMCHSVLRCASINRPTEIDTWSLQSIQWATDCYKKSIDSCSTEENAGAGGVRE